MKTSAETAKRLISLNFSVIPVKDKRPQLSTWKPFQNLAMNETEINEHFPADAIAIITGFKRLEVIDVDTKNDPTGTLWPDLWNMIRDNLPDIAGRLYVVVTPSGGRHIYYRCQKPDNNLKLASTTRGETLIETRGAGGYVVAPPSPGYRPERNQPEKVPFITEQQREILLSVCRSFDEAPATPPQPRKQPNNSGKYQTAGLSPFEDYDSHSDPVALLERHGWKAVKHAGDRIYLKRPGETKAPISGNFHTGSNRFISWTTSTQFEAGKPYSPTAVFALLECAGDLSEASRRLYSQGYGERRKEPENGQLIDLYIPEDIIVNFPNL